MEPHLPSSINFDIDWRDLIGRQLDLLVSRSDDILQSPAKLGELLSICTIFAQLEPIVRERATALATQKKEIPGWTLVHRDGNSYVEATHISELGRTCPLENLQSFVNALATTLGHVSQAKYERLCSAARLEPQPGAIKQSGATVFLRRNSHGENQPTIER